MTQVVGFRPEDWPAARDAINAVRRGGLEHPFHRRRTIVDVGEETVLLKSAETANILGPQMPFTGVTSAAATTGKAYLVDEAANTYDNTVELDLDTSNIGSSLLMPNLDATYSLNAQYTCRARKIGDTYYATSGGTTSFAGTIVAILGGGIYTVSPYLPTGATAIAAKALFDETFAVDQECFVIMYGSTPYVTHGDCVP